MLRDYQKRSIDMLYDWIRKNDGNPCLVLPTGAGKSWIIAELCRDALTKWKDTRILMLSHQKELIEQDADKLRILWKNAPMGIYSASIGKREIGEAITFASIQSIAKKHNLIGHIDLVIIDECHTISHKDEGQYRMLLNNLKLINPQMRIVGLTATPYRLGHGLITDKPALFDALIEPVTIKELLNLGFLAPLRSKFTKEKLDVTGVHKRGGEYIEAELQAAVDKSDKNSSVVDEVIQLAEDRKSWLFFCVGVEHSEHIRDELIARGISAELVTGNLSKLERERILKEFKSGKIQALTNYGVLTTGFDHPDIDLIVMLRPSMSPALYVQMAGRGLRPKSHTNHCLVLDFAGIVEKHGPITNVIPPKKAGSGEGEAPTRPCPECHEICHISTPECPNCGYQFPPAKEKEFSLNHKFDIMGLELPELELSAWEWSTHLSKKENRLCFKIKYFGALSDPVITQYLCVLHDGFAGARAMRELTKLAESTSVNLKDYDGLHEVCLAMNEKQPPQLIKYQKNGKFYEVKEIVF